MLRVDELDLAFLSVTERIESHGLGLHQLVSEELVVVLPRDHRLGQRRRLRMAELADEQFISYREGARLRELLLVSRPATPASNRGSSSSPTRASGSGGWSSAAWASRSCPARTPRRPGAEVVVASLTDPLSDPRHHARLARRPPPRCRPPPSSSSSPGTPSPDRSRARSSGFSPQNEATGLPLKSAISRVALRLVQAARVQLAWAGVEARDVVAEPARLGLERVQQRPADPGPRRSESRTSS